MWSRRKRGEGHRATLAVLLLGLGLGPAATAADFTIANIVWLPSQPSQLALRLSGQLAEATALGDSGRWTVQSLDLNDGSETSVHPQSVTIQRQVVTLVLPEPLRPWDASGAALHQVSVRFFLPPNVVEGRLARASGQTHAAASGYEAARGKADADTYLSGAFATARGARPTYTGEAKLQREFVTAAGGRVGATFDLAAANETNIDPDSLQAGVTYAALLGRSRWLSLQADLLSGEFSRQDDVRNLASSATVTAILDPWAFGRNTTLSLEPFAGFEAGRNLARDDVSGDRNVLRGVLGANAYLLAKPKVSGLDRISLSATFTLRLPQTDEPYSQTRDGATITSLTQRARPYLSADLSFQFGGGYSVALQYRNGSLPPAFARVDHSVALALVVQRKYNRK